jgi:hypothetical protein
MTTGYQVGLGPSGLLVELIAWVRTWVSGFLRTLDLGTSISCCSDARGASGLLAAAAADTS